jgi:hypothetical protein
MLSNFQIDEKPVMQCFLLGQDPLEEKLNIPELVHLKQRVLASTRLESLTQQETREYIMHRLLKSGWDNNPIIRDTAFSLIYYYSQGVPRRINSLCGRVLLQSYLDERHDIGADLVQHVIEELQDELLEHEGAIGPDFAHTQKVFTTPPGPPGNKDFGNNSGSNDCNVNSGVTSNGNPSSPPQLPAEQTLTMDNNSANVINIPEFIKKKEINFTRSNAPASILITRSDATNAVLARNETEPDEISALEPHMDPVPVNDNVESCLHNMPQVKPPVGALVKNQPLRPPSIKPTQQERQSGLVDKELQALASLCEAPAFTQSLRTKQNPPESIKEHSPDAAPAKKIIIDDLAYEQFERREPSNLTHDITGEKPVSASQYQHWRPPVTVFIILAGMALSLYWGYDGNTEIVVKNSESHPISMVYETSVIDLITPQVQTTLLVKTDTPEVAAEFITAPDAGLISEFTDTGPAMAADITGESPATPVSAGTAGSGSSSGGDKKTGANPAVTPAAPRKAKTLAPARKPMVGAPLALMENSASYAGSANSQQPPGKTGNATQSAALSEQAVITAQGALAISRMDLNRLLSTLAIAYENGNLQQLISTFAKDIHSSDGTSRQQMENDYRRLFNITDTRQLNIHDISWSPQDKQMLGKGDFQVRVREKGAAKYTTYEGTISLAVVKESNNIVIKKLDYNYNN